MQLARNERLKLKWIGDALRLSAIALIASAILPGLDAEVKANEREPIRLTNGAAEVQGTTAGTDNLTQLAARDHRRKLCLGYAAVEPSHTLVLTETQPHLRIAVNSDGNDTTLLINGPMGIDCNDNHSRSNRDAAVTDSGWLPGTYQIWVGSFNQGEQINYRLRIFEPGSADRR